MKRSLSRFKKPATFIRFSMLGLVMAGAGFTGMRLLGNSSAATAYSHNPIGAADSCTLEGNNTVLYGWAHDPDAPAGALPSVSVTVGNSTIGLPTSQAGYRDASINTFITTSYPGMPTSSVYGWRLQLSGLYKGTTNKVSGTLINYGTGTNATMPINSSANVGNTYFTPSKTIPDACLANQPTPSPSPTPTPTPSPSPTPAPSKTPTKTTTKTPAGATPSTAPSNATDATLTIGTTAVSLKIPADQATTLHLQYGSDPSKLDQSTADQATNGSDVTVPITGLGAKTAYSFQIVRTQDNQSATSAVTTFATKGYSLNLLFISGKNKPVAGIKTTLGPTKATSDKNGKLAFTDLSAGTYSPIFSYQGHNHSQTFNTYTITPSDKPVAASLQQTINLDKLTTTAAITSVKSSGHSLVVPIIAGILCFILLAAIIWFILRRRSTNDTGAILPITAPAPNTDIIDQQSHHHFSKQNPPATEPPPEHMGKSLREMVLESMRQEAAKRKDQQPPQ